MRKSFFTRLKSCVLTPNMLLSVCISMIALLWWKIRNVILFNAYIGEMSLFESGDMFLEEIFQSHARSGYGLFAPILAVLPSATMFCDEYNAGYIKSILVRTSRKNYTLETVACALISGGLAVMLPSLLSGLFFMWIGEPNVAGKYDTYLSESIFAGIQYVFNGGLVFVLYQVFAFIFGAVWACVGLSISSILPNRYVALAAPFALYFASHLFFYRLDCTVFSPVNMLMPIESFLPNLLYPFLYQYVLLMISLMVFRKMMGRRLQNV